MRYGSTKPAWRPGMLIASVLALVLQLAGATPSSSQTASASPPGAFCPGDNGGCDLSGVDKIEEADGLLSVCLQHEVDQLDGIFWIYRLSRLKRDRVVKRFDKTQRTQASGD
jgi:hypothetical protein